MNLSSALCKVGDEGFKFMRKRQFSFFWYKRTFKIQISIFWFQSSVRNSFAFNKQLLRTAILEHYLAFKLFKEEIRNEENGESSCINLRVIFPELKRFGSQGFANIWFESQVSTQFLPPMWSIVVGIIIHFDKLENKWG